MNDELLHMTIPPMLPAKEQRRLEQLMPTSKKARDAMISGNMPFVVSQAKRFAHNGVPLSDLVEEGMFGLCVAAKKYRPDVGVHFISYAVHWVRRYCQKAITDTGNTVRQPTNKIKERYAVQHHREMKMQAELRHVSMNEAIDDIFGGPREGVVHWVIRPDSGEWAEPQNWRDPANQGFWSAISPIPPEEYDDTPDFIATQLTQLPKRQRDILTRYYAGETLAGIAETYGLTRERIRQIRDQALKTLRHRLTKQKQELLT